MNRGEIWWFELPGDGMPTKCALALVNVLPVRKALLSKRITQLGPDKLAEWCVSLNTATGC